MYIHISAVTGPAPHWRPRPTGPPAPPDTRPNAAAFRAPRVSGRGEIRGSREIEAYAGVPPPGAGVRTVLEGGDIFWAVVRGALSESRPGGTLPSSVSKVPRSVS